MSLLSFILTTTLNYVQVRSRPLGNFLTKTVIETGCLLEKRVHLILGFSQLEWEQANCGIFLYWHGRLIEVSNWPYCRLNHLWAFGTRLILKNRGCDRFFLSYDK